MKEKLPKMVNPETKVSFCCVSLEAYQSLPGKKIEDCAAHSKLFPSRQHMRRIPRTEQAAGDSLLTRALLAAVVLIAVTQTGAGCDDRYQRDPGWGLVAETEVQARAPAQVLAVTMVGLVIEARRKRIRNHYNVSCMTPQRGHLCVAPGKFSSKIC